MKFNSVRRLALTEFSVKRLIIASLALITLLSPFELSLADQPPQIIREIKRISAATTVYNFEVAKTHTYSVSAAALVVHNTKNRWPNLVVNDVPKPVQVLDRSALASSNFDDLPFVVDLNGNLRVGPFASEAGITKHIDLAASKYFTSEVEDVLAAGMIRGRDSSGFLIVDNWSGHFKTHGPEVGVVIKEAFSKEGYLVDYQPAF